MKKTLNLSIDESVIQRAKRYARQHRTSVSAIVEEELIKKTGEQTWQPRPGTLTAKLAGSLPLPSTGKSDDELLTDALNEKYGNDPDRQ